MKNIFFAPLLELKSFPRRIHLAELSTAASYCRRFSVFSQKIGKIFALKLFSQNLWVRSSWQSRLGWRGNRTQIKDSGGEGAMSGWLAVEHTENLLLGIRSRCFKFFYCATLFTISRAVKWMRRVKFFSTFIPQSKRAQPLSKLMTYEAEDLRQFIARALAECDCRWCDVLHA